jgi:hypothetical protein
LITFHVTKGHFMYRYILFFAVICALCSMAAVAQTEQSEYFLTRLGRDTIAVEEFSADAHGLRGTCVARSPRTTVRDYSASFNAEGGLENFHVTSRLNSGALVYERDYAYSNDTVHVTIKQDTSTTRYAVAVHDRPFPLFVDIFGGWEITLQHAQAANKKQFGILAGKRVLQYTIEGSSPGMLDLTNSAGDFAPIHVETGKDGRIEKFDMTATTDKFIAERISVVDVKAMAKEFAERERSGKALGVLSPRDTARAEINGAHLMIDYGRPAARGRSIFGRVVPWDSVWRTGANAATQFTTDKELQFGSTTVPPGTYTLFTLPRTGGGWLLIINRQHGQWGTDYDVSKDLARLPLEIKQTDDLIERFTVGITPVDTRGVLHFEWEHTEASIPFIVR